MSRYAGNRRVVHEFGSYVMAHYRIMQSLDTIDPILLREKMNDLMMEWIGNGFRCKHRYCRYCSTVAPSKDFVRKFKDRLGTEPETTGYRRDSNHEA